MTLSYALATLNALLNSLAAVLMLLGFRAIKAKRIETHRKFMLAAFTTSALFLVSYLTRFALFQDTPFAGQGPIRYVYFAILIPHVILAVAVTPAVIQTLRLGLRDDRARHKRLARWTFPVWVYVSVTGVLVYLFLYHFYPSY